MVSHLPVSLSHLIVLLIQLVTFGILLLHKSNLYFILTLSLPAANNHIRACG